MFSRTHKRPKFNTFFLNYIFNNIYRFRINLANLFLVARKMAFISMYISAFVASVFKRGRQ